MSGMSTQANKPATAGFIDFYSNKFRIDIALPMDDARKVRPMQAQPPTSKAPSSAKPPWSKRLPPLGRFIVWNLIWWLLGCAALAGGLSYTEHVVKPIAEAGGESFGPGTLWEKEDAGKRVFGSTERINILVVGIDYNYDNKGILYTKGARSDTIIVLSLSRDAKFFNVVSIPRDTQVQISEDIGYDKINSAYSYGGIEQAMQTVSNFLDIPIHHYVIVKVKSANQVIDALDGLPIDVEKDMDYDDNWGKLHIHLKAGPQILNGEQTVGYARFRMDEEGDRGRIRRQQQVVRALGRKLKEPALLTRIPELAQVVKENVETDLKILEMVDLANLYSSFDFSKMRSAAIVGDDAMDANGTSYIVPYFVENDRTVRRLLKNYDRLPKSDLRIRIYFRLASSDLAYNLADTLAQAGFTSVKVEALPLESGPSSERTHLIWYNEVPRLKGIISSILDSPSATTGTAPEGKDDDLAIVLGDQESGDWKELPPEMVSPEPEETPAYEEDRDEASFSESRDTRERRQDRNDPARTSPETDDPRRQDSWENHSESGRTEDPTQSRTSRDETYPRSEAPAAPVNSPEPTRRRQPERTSAPTRAERPVAQPVEIPLDAAPPAAPVPTRIEIAEPIPQATPMF